MGLPVKTGLDSCPDRTKTGFSTIRKTDVSRIVATFRAPPAVRLYRIGQAERGRRVYMRSVAVMLTKATFVLFRRAKIRLTLVQVSSLKASSREENERITYPLTMAEIESQQVYLILIIWALPFSPGMPPASACRVVCAWLGWAHRLKGVYNRGLRTGWATGFVGLRRCPGYPVGCAGRYL